MKLEEINKIIDIQIIDLGKKLKGNYKDNELLSKILKGKISTLKIIKNNFKTKFAEQKKGEDK